MARILLITAELTSIPGVPTGGLGIRIEGLVHGLRAHGHTIVLSFLAANIAHLETSRQVTIPAELKQLPFDPANSRRIIAEVNPDVIICSPWQLAELIDDRDWPASIPLVYDLPGMLSLENVFSRREASLLFLQKKATALARGDLFCVSNPRQVYYLYPLLQLAGVDLRVDPVRVVPFAVLPAPAAPLRSYPDPPVLIVSGVHWPWLNHGHSLATAAAFVDTNGGELHLYRGGFLYRDEPPVPSELDGFRNVRQFGLIDHAELLERYRQSSAALELYQPNPERNLASTTRTIEYLGTGLPVIYTAGMYYAELIRDYDAGWVIAPDDAPALQAILAEIRTNPELCRTKGANAIRLARECFDPVAAARPLAEFCAHPEKLRNRPTLFYRQARALQAGFGELRFLRQRLDQARRDTDRLRRQLEADGRRRVDLEQDRDRWRSEAGLLAADLKRITGRFSFRVLLRIKKLGEAIGDLLTLKRPS